MKTMPYLDESQKTPAKANPAPRAAQSPAAAPTMDALEALRRLSPVDWVLLLAMVGGLARWLLS